MGAIRHNRTNPERNEPGFRANIPPPPQRDIKIDVGFRDNIFAPPMRSGIVRANTCVPDRPGLQGSNGNVVNVAGYKCGWVRGWDFAAIVFLTVAAQAYACR